MKIKMQEWMSGYVWQSSLPKTKLQLQQKAAITDIENAIAVQKGSEVQQKDHLPAPPISMTENQSQKIVEESSDEARAKRSNIMDDSNNDEDEDHMTSGLRSFFGSRAM